MTEIATDRKLRVGVIGVGRIGALRAEALAHRVPEAELVSIADIDRPAAERVSRDVSVSRVTTDYREMLSDVAIDAVFVCTPTDTHAEIMVDAAAAGKHIFVEKPVDLSLDGVDHALSAIKQAGVLLQVGMNRRFDPTYARVRRAVAEGEIGEVQLLHIISRDPAPPPLAYVRTSGGLFADMMIHDFDMARFLAGSEVESVFARGAVRISPEIVLAGDIDTAVVLLTFQNGALGTIDNSRQAVYGYDQRVEILGSLGGISTGNVYPNQVTLSTAANIHRDLPLNFFMQRYAESYVLETAAFVDAVLHGRAPTPSGEDGRAALQIAMAARRSLETGQPVQVTDAGALAAATGA